MQLVDHVGQFFVLYITRSGERFFVLISSCSQENDGGVYMRARCKSECNINNGIVKVDVRSDIL